MKPSPKSVILPALERMKRRTGFAVFHSSADWTKPAMPVALGEVVLVGGGPADQVDAPKKA